MRTNTTFTLASLLILNLLPSVAESQQVPKFICANNQTEIITLRARCRSNETRVRNRSQLVGAEGPAGVNGVNGTDGQDGSIAVWGNGSDGNITFSTDDTFDPLKQYNNIVINAGVTLTVPAGTTIRCAGTFTNNGTIEVQAFGGGSQIYQISPGLSIPNNFPPPHGFAPSAAGNGVPGDNSAQIWGGGGGFGFGAEGGGDPKVLIRGAWISSGVGGGVEGGNGGPAGGVIRILSRGQITIASGASVVANGLDGGTGGGGGGGGLILLASATGITMSGTLAVEGGDGGPASSTTAHGGGGGGGVVILAAPSVAAGGTISLTEGSNGAAAAPGTVTSNPRTSGGGGGASCGQGATGGFVNVDGSTSGGGASPTDGCQYTIVTDPTSLLF